MKNFTKHAFTLVELLVVIAILAIISVVAYQNFGGATDKANAGRKVSDISTIETSLQQYKVDNNFYPNVDILDANTNMWGYNSSDVATPSNTLTTTKNGEEIATIASANGGGRVMGSGTINNKQIGAKGVISQQTLGKKYLTKDLYDPELGDIKVGSSGKMVDAGVGRYVYGVYRKPLSADTNWTSNKKGSYYNLAYTVKKENSDIYITRIVGDYDRESCFENRNNCPNTLIGGNTANGFLKDKEENSNSDTSLGNQGIPYPLTGY